MNFEGLDTEKQKSILGEGVPITSQGKVESVVKSTDVVSTSGKVDKDQIKIEQVRRDLGLSELEKTTNQKGWRVVFRPRLEWEQGKEQGGQHFLDRFVGFLGVSSKDEKGLARQFNHDRERFPERRFNYNKGAGIEGYVTDKASILATGFLDCSGLVFQTQDRVAVLHISPNVIRDVSEGGDIVENRDVYGHLRSVLKKILSDSEQTERVVTSAPLSAEEINHLQKMFDSGKLRATMLAGEEKYAPSIPIDLAERAQFNGLPSLKTDVYYVGNLGGGGGYAVYASPDSLYFLGSNDKIIKIVPGALPAMFDYENK